MKSRCLVLRGLGNLAKHLAGPREVEATTWTQLAECRKHVMCTVNICIHRREAVMKTLGDETLRSEVIALVKIILTDNMKDGRVTLQARWVKSYLLEQMFDPAKPSLRIFQRDTPDKTMHFVP